MNSVRRKFIEQTNSHKRATQAVARLRRALCVLLITVAAIFSAVTALHLKASAHEGEDHSQPTRATTTTNVAARPAVAVRTAERNVQTEAGNFRAQLRQAPTDPRAGEEAQFEIALTEKIEGGFGGAGDQPVAGTVTARVTTAAGQTLAGNLATHAEGNPPHPGVYGVHYAFPDNGEYKIFFDARTQDGRTFSVDFPVSVVHAPTNWLFWLGLGILTLLSGGTIYGYYYSWRIERDEIDGERVPATVAWRKTLPVAIAALIFFSVGTAALAYFSPPRERRDIAHLSPPTANDAGATTSVATAGDPALGGSGAILTISKDSQLLFGIRTAPVTERQIVGGLKVAGVVRARPDARAVISPPVSGRVFLDGGIRLGAAIGRGERVGYVEQILGAPEQASLEGQRIQLRTAALEQQARATEQQSLAQQALTRLTQARRELQRATNLVEAGAAPRRRVEEAQTAVLLAGQEVASAEQQARIASQQAGLARDSVARVDPVRTFPLLSPITGLVSTLNVATGQQVEAGAELLNIVNLSTVFLEAQVFERDLPTVRESRRASYTAAAMPDEVYRIGEGGDGQLVTIGQAIEPRTRTAGVIYEVPNPLNRLRDGMFVEITIDTTGNKSVLSVPKEAVITEQGRTFIFVFRGGETYEKRVVVLGSAGQDYNEVRSGVQAGERVVTEGIYQLRSTQPGA